MSKQVIVLNVEQTVPGLTQVRVLFWLTAPVTAPILMPGISSMWPGASAAENTALQNGMTVEEEYTFHFAGTKTKAQIEADILAAFQSRQTTFTANPPGAFFGLCYDSATGWSG